MRFIGKMNSLSSGLNPFNILEKMKYSTFLVY